MIRRVVRLRAARRIAQVVGQLAAQRALDDGLLEASDRHLELLGRERPLPHKLIENLGGHRRERRVRHQWLASAGHRGSSCYAPHTKFLTPSLPIENCSICDD
jgi:hypothetical protein